MNCNPSEKTNKAPRRLVPFGVESLFHIILLLLLLCALVSVPFASAQETVRIGRTVSTCGAVTFDSGLIAEGFDFWYKDVQARGGVVMSGYDDLLHDIELITLQDSSEGQIVDVQYRELITFRGVHILTGPFGGALSTVAARRSSFTQTPLVTSAGLSDAILNANYQHYFSVQTPYGLRTEACMRLFNSSTNLKTMMIISSEDAFQRIATRDFVNSATKYGFVVVQNFTFPNASDTYGPVLEFLQHNKSARPDMIFISGNPIVVTDFIPKLRRVYDPKMIFVSNGGALASLKESLTWEGEYIVDATQWSANLNYSDEYYGSSLGFKAAFENRTGKRMELFHAAGYTAGYIIEKALQRTKSLNNTDLIYALRSLNLTSLWGNIFFGDEIYTLSTPICAQIINREITTIAPPSLAVEKLVFPAYPIRPPPPKYSDTDYLMMKIFGSIAGGIVLILIVGGIFLYFHGKYHFITIPKNEDNAEWGTEGHINAAADTGRRGNWFSRLFR
jgi:branched-chain amino acid transport system substrate-binding protein